MTEPRMTKTTERDARESRASRAARPAAERQAIVKNMFIGHDRFDEATRAIAEFHMPVAGGTHDTGSLFALAGCSRAGKTFTLKRYASGFPSYAGETGIVRPVVYVEMPVGTSKRSMVDRIAAVLNMRYAPKTNVDALLDLVLQQLRRQRVQLLILDEFQEAFASSRPQAAKDCMATLRKVLNVGTLNVVAGGLVETYRILEKDAQLYGRGLLPHVVVEPYEWSGKEQRDLFRLICAYVDERMPFEKKSGLSSAWYAERLHWVSDGIIGHLKDFVHLAACRAINDGSVAVTAEHFALAWDRIRPVGMTFNPFRDEMGGAPARRVVEATKAGPVTFVKSAARDAA